MDVASSSATTLASDVRACDGHFDSAIVLSKMLWRAYEEFKILRIRFWASGVADKLIPKGSGSGFPSDVHGP